MKFLILDTETTGLYEPQAAEIAYIPMPATLSEFKDLYCEFAKVNFDFKAKEFDFVFNERFRPRKPIETKASQLTGIWPKDVFDKPWIDTFELPDTTEVLIGHNISYDKKVLSWKDPKNPIPVSLICTKELAQIAFQGKGYKNNKLTTLIETLFPEHVEMLQFAHGAYQDCLFVFMLLGKILEEIPALEWEDLIKLCSQGKKKYEEIDKPLKEITVMPFGKHKDKNLTEIPKDYLIWLLGNTDLSPALEVAIRKVL